MGQIKPQKMKEVDDFQKLHENYSNSRQRILINTQDMSFWKIFFVGFYPEKSFFFRKVIDLDTDDLQFRVETIIY